MCEHRRCAVKEHGGASLRAGLLAKLKPPKGVSPLQAAIPGAKREALRKEGESILAAIRRWLQHRRAIRQRCQADTRALIGADEVLAYYEASVAPPGRVRGDPRESTTGQRSPPRRTVRCKGDAFAACEPRPAREAAPRLG